MAIRFRHRAGNVSPVGTFALDQQSTLRPYALWDDSNDDFPVIPTNEQLHAQILALLGFTEQFPTAPAGAPGGLGSINRVLPAADPQFPSLFADSISLSVQQGEGFQAASNADSRLAQLPLQGHTAFNAYELAVRFNHRPYAVVPNDRMERSELEFFDTDGTRKRLYHYPEWLRYVTPLWREIDTNVSATAAAAMRFRAPGSVVNDTPFNGVPSFAVPDSALTLTWWGIPLRYLTHPNCFLTKFKGYVNQVEWNGFQPAQLLYTGARVLRTYPQCDFSGADLRIDGVPTSGVDDPILLGTFFDELCVDLQLNFVVTVRTAGVEIPDVDIVNKNWIPQGHNLLPHFYTRKFFYATNNSVNPAERVPSYLSVPFQLLFQDPEFDPVTPA